MADRLRFGEFELDLDAYTLWRGREPLKLEKLPMELLIRLAGHAGRLVEREALRQALWGSDVFVDHEAAINTAVRKIRRVLGDNADAPRVIETVVGKGYRFIASIAVAPPSATALLAAYCVTRGKRRFVLDLAENLVGRDPHARIHIEHRSVSRRHARISIHADGAVLEDLDSRNGTFLDGHRLTAPAELADGAVIGLGGIVLRFHVLSNGASTEPLGDRRRSRPKT